MSVKFPHKAPRGLYYTQTQFKRNITAIWIHYDRQFDYNNGKPVKCIWGFFNSKTEQWHSPVNSSTVGSVVDPMRTSPYSAMLIKLNPLMSCFE
jgi:hypothetical protein